jgi:hypothetical protein
MKTLASHVHPSHWIGARLCARSFLQQCSGRGLRRSTKDVQAQNVYVQTVHYCAQRAAGEGEGCLTSLVS